MVTKQKLIYTALALSLALNLFFIGAAANYTMKWRGFANDAEWIDERLSRAEERVVGQLDGADKALARRVFKERRPELLDALADLRAARKAFRASLSVEEPNPQDITNALNRSQAAAQKLNENLHGALRDMGSGLSPEARAKIAAHMMRRHRND